MFSFEPAPQTVVKEKVKRSLLLLVQTSPLPFGFSVIFNLWISQVVWVVGISGTGAVHMWSGMNKSLFCSPQSRLVPTKWSTFSNSQLSFSLFLHFLCCFVANDRLFWFPLVLYPCPKSQLDPRMKLSFLFWQQRCRPSRSGVHTAWGELDEDIHQMILWELQLLLAQHLQITLVSNVWLKCWHRVVLWTQKHKAAAWASC